MLCHRDLLLYITPLRQKSRNKNLIQSTILFLLNTNTLKRLTVENLSILANQYGCSLDLMRKGQFLAFTACLNCFKHTKAYTVNTKTDQNTDIPRKIQQYCFRLLMALYAQTDMQSISKFPQLKSKFIPVFTTVTFQIYMQVQINLFYKCIAQNVEKHVKQRLIKCGFLFVTIAAILDTLCNISVGSFQITITRLSVATLSTWGESWYQFHFYKCLLDVEKLLNPNGGMFICFPSIC